MSEWKEYKLGEVISFGNGKERPKEKGSIPVYGGNGILDYTNTHNYEGETIILGRVGAYCGSVYYSNTPIWVSDNALVAKPKEGHNTKFFYYYLTHIKLNDYAEGSSHPLITQRLLNSIDIRIPTHELEQRSISSILTSLDDKIDLLRRENATLEAMAETLFRQWFVVEAKEEWEEGKVIDLTKHVKDSINPQKYPNTVFQHYSIPAYDDGKKPTIETGENIQSNKYVIPQKSILFSKLNPHKDKRVWLMLDDVPDNAVCSTEFQIVKPNNSEYFLYFMYGWLTFKDNYEEIASGVGGTSGSHQRIDPKSIFAFACPKVDMETIRNYNKKIEPLFYKQRNNQLQIQTLIQTRDGLLPRLMSNEIKITI